MEEILQVIDLKISFPAPGGRLQALRGVNLALQKGETLALVGESGSGKSVTAKAVMGLLPGNAAVTAGQILYGGNNLLALPERDMQKIRGGRITMIFQDPLSSLDPTMTVGRQISEVLRLKGMDRKSARLQALKLMEEVGIEEAEKRFAQYPFAFSGGMRQRIVIAMALAEDPDILICDEPTSALDVTIQAQILDTISRLKTERGLSVLFITHDLGVAAGMADRIAVMHEGEIVECGRTEALLKNPSHPYTASLLAAASAYVRAGGGQNPEAAGEEPSENPEAPDNVLLTVEHLSKAFGNAKAVEDVSFTIRRGEIFGLVGESGCGKTTTARCIAGLYVPTGGRIKFSWKRSALKDGQGRVQMIFQDPAASLDPRMTVQDIIAEGLVIRGLTDKKEIRRRVGEIMALTGLEPEHAARYPHELSGGQRQRVGIARAVILQPELIIADEPVSALDAQVRGQIIRLLGELKERFGMAMLFIAHDLSVVRHFSDRIGVMYRGRLVELAPAEELFRRPLHPYTRSLLSAAPAAKKTGLTEISAKDSFRVSFSENSPDDKCFFQEAEKGHFVLFYEKDALENDVFNLKNSEA